MPDKQDIRETLSDYWKTGNAGIAIGVILAIAVLSTPFIIEAAFLEKSSVDLDASVNVIAPRNNTTVGASVDSGQSLEFGKIEDGMINITKSFTVETGRPTLARVNSEGNISKFLRYDEEHLFSGSKDVRVKMVPNGTGNYSGVVHVKVQAANNDLGEQWLKLKSRLW
jgi:hypothetical protein